MQLRAYAKINLFLRVVGRRTDGYHELETVFQAVSLCDDVTLEPTDGPWDPAQPHLRCEDPTVPVDGTNLAWRAAVALAERAGAPPYDVSIRLAKRIPPGGGLGGGSSDAAAVLAGLRRLWALRIEDATLMEVAAGLGSDVPFFLMGGTVLGTGRGEVLTPLPSPAALHLVLVTPTFGVSTPWAYAARVEAAADAPPLSCFRTALIDGSPAALAAALRNDLEAGVAARHPEIEELRQELLRAGALGARMTGSGSTVFGVAQDAADAHRLASALVRPDRRVSAVQAFSAAETRLL